MLKAIVLNCLIDFFSRSSAHCRYPLISIVADKNEKNPRCERKPFVRAANSGVHPLMLSAICTHKAFAGHIPRPGGLLLMLKLSIYMLFQVNP